MSYTKRPEPGPMPSRPAWWGPRIGLTACAMFLAALSVVYWWRQMDHQGGAMATYVAASFAITAMMTPVLSPYILRARGVARVGMVFAVAMFTLWDAGGFTVALRGLEADITAEAYTPKRAAHDRMAAEADRLVAGIQAKLVAIPTPSAEGEIRNRQTYLDTVATIERQLRAAEAARAALPSAPVRPDLFDDRLLAAMALLIQVALVIGFLSIEAGRARAHADALAAREAAFAQAVETYRAKRSRAGKKASKAKTGKSAQRETAADGWPPKLVASNG